MARISRPMHLFLLGVVFSGVMLAFCPTAAANHHGTCIKRRSYSKEPLGDYISREDAEIEDPTYYGSGRQTTVKIRVYRRCGKRLCKVHRAKVYKRDCGSNCRRKCTYYKRLSTFTCRSHRYRFDIQIYFPKHHRSLFLKGVRYSASVRAVMPTRYRIQKLDMSKLTACKIFPRTITVTEAMQGKTCPSGRIRYPVNSQQDLSKRTLDGRLNNPKKIFYGAAGENLLRLSGNGYGDKVFTLSGACSKKQRDTNTCPFPKENNGTGSNRPNPRVISNVLLRQSKDIQSRRGLSDLNVYFGQFLDHDTDLTDELPRSFEHELPNDLEIPINVPKGDAIFDPDSKGDQTMHVRRFNFDSCTGERHKVAREQVGSISAIIDANTVYGSSETRSKALRTLKDGLMKTDKGNLPLNTFNLPNANAIGRDPTKLRIAGDKRANVAPTLLALHTVFVREHNRLAKAYKKRYPKASDERIFQYARKFVIAEMQAITYEEYIPSILGRKLPKYKGYNPNINTGIATEFSTAAFRFGHTQINEKVFRFDKNWKVSPFGHVLLREGFFAPERVTREGGVTPIFRGAVRQPAQEIDVHVVDELRNFLFPKKGTSLDLGAINIQRGRETGIPDYNTVRKALGLKRIKRFSEITRNKAVARKLKSLYLNVNNIDLWVGGIAEDHVKGSELGPTFEKIFINQMTRLRDGDRFWYRRVLSDREVQLVHKNTLGRIIQLNTGYSQPPRNVFFSDDVCKGVKNFQCVKDFYLSY